MMSAVGATNRTMEGRKLLWVPLLAALLLLAWCRTASADLAIEPGAGGFKVETSSNQAGAHADLTTAFKFTTNSYAEPGANLRNVSVELPPGFVGAPAAVPTCDPNLLTSKSGGFESECPVDTQVGNTTVRLTVAEGRSGSFRVPVYNMTPSKKQTAVFAFDVSGILEVYIVFSTRPHSYGITATTTNISGDVEVDSDSITIWGVPAASSHDPERGQICFVNVEGKANCPFGGNEKAGMSPVPFLTNPTECTNEPLEARLHVASWQDYPARVSAITAVGPMIGCEHLSFDPTLSLRPTIMQADSPTGYGLDLRVPQDNQPEGLASRGVRDVSVTLPAGTALSPSAATGLVGCQPTGSEGINIDGPESEEVDLIGDVHPTRGRCSLASELGTVKITSPLLSEPFEGHLFLAEPQCGGGGQPECTPRDATNGKLYGLYLEAEGDGVVIKLQGSASVDPATGQITGTFRENPQAPFSDLRLEFFGGPRSPLVNPRVCGSAVTTSVLTSFSGLAPAEPFSGFTITGCPGPEFAPSFAAGSTSNQAGDYTPLSVTFSRQDLEGEFGEVTVTTPPGLLGRLSHVTLCPEPQAARGTCPASSQIGEVTERGPGSDAADGRGRRWGRALRSARAPHRGKPGVLPRSSQPAHEHDRSALHGLRGGAA